MANLTNHPRGKPTRPFACYECGTKQTPTVTDAQQMLSVPTRMIVMEEDGSYHRISAKRLHASVRCKHCGHEWWSRHPEALELSRAKDARNRHPRGPHGQ